MKFEDFLKDIEKNFGKEAIVGQKVECEFISSGSISLDLALGGGFARGRLAEMFGWESSGKSTLALHLAAEVQKFGLNVGYIDLENALDVDYASALDVNIDFNGKFILSQPDCGEDALEIMKKMIQIDGIGLVVLDSLGALLPKAKLQGEAGDSKMGLEARLMSSQLPIIAQLAKKNNCIVLFINQKREKIGVMFGNPETTMAGNAMKFYASQRLDVARAGQEKDGDEVTANKTRVKIVKNKVAPPFKKAEFNIEFGTGIDKVLELIEISVDFSIIKKSGSWYSYGDVKLGQGATGVKSILNDNPELYDEIKNKVYETIGI